MLPDASAKLRIDAIITSIFSFILVYGLRYFCHLSLLAIKILYSPIYIISYLNR